VPTDWTDWVLERWSALRPEFDAEASEVVDRIGRIALLVGRWQEEAFGRYGLNRGDVGVLSALRVTGPPGRLSPGRLLKVLMLSSAGITSRLDRLERRGLVRRVPDPDDRRGVLVELTGTGEELVDAAVAANAESQRRMLSGLSREEVAELARLLRKLQASVERSGAP